MARSLAPAPPSRRRTLLALGLAVGMGTGAAEAAVPALLMPPGPAGDRALPWPGALQFAQSSWRGARRQYADHDDAYANAERGEVKRLGELLPPAQSACQGVEYIGVEPDMEMRVYRMKFMQAGGRVCWADMDARTGRVIAVRK